MLNKKIYDTYSRLNVPDKLLFTYYMLNNDFLSMTNLVTCHISIVDEFIIFESNSRKSIKQTMNKLVMDGFIISTDNKLKGKSDSYKYAKYCNIIGLTNPICLN